MSDDFKPKKVSSSMELTQMVTLGKLIPDKSFLRSQSDGRLYKFLRTMPWQGNVGVVLRDDTGDVDVYSKNEFRDLSFFTVEGGETREDFVDPA